MGLKYPNTANMSSHVYTHYIQDRS